MCVDLLVTEDFRSVHGNLGHVPALPGKEAFS
jgi:hypothetical protein